MFIAIEAMHTAASFPAFSSVPRIVLKPRKRGEEEAEEGSEPLMPLPAGQDFSRGKFLVLRKAGREFHVTKVDIHFSAFRN